MQLPMSGLVNLRTLNRENNQLATLPDLSWLLNLRRRECIGNWLTLAIAEILEIHGQLPNYLFRTKNMITKGAPSNVLHRIVSSLQI